MPAQLTLYYPWQPAQVIALPQTGVHVLGRADDCAVRLHDPSVSRHHATLRCDTADWQLKDLNSKNGTWCGGEPVQQWQSLGDAVPLRFGNLPARFEALSEQESQQQQQRYQRRQLQVKQSYEAWYEQAGNEVGLLQQIVVDLLQLAEAERGFVLLADKQGGWRHLALGYGQQEAEGAAFGGSHGAVQLALQRGRPVAISDLTGWPELAQRHSVRRQGLRALVCLPLRFDDQTVGALYADSRVPGKQYTELDLSILTSLAEQAAMILHAQHLACQLQQLQGQVLMQPEQSVMYRRQ